MRARLDARSFLKLLCAVCFVASVGAAPIHAQQTRPSDDTFKTVASLFAYDIKLPLNARVIAKFDTATFTREKIVIDGWRHTRVPGLIAVPHAAAPRHPVILLIDGIGGWKERWWDRTSWNRGRVLIDSLIANGFAVAMIDAPASGERIYENDFETAETFIGKPAQWREMAIQNTIEIRRLIDYLHTRADIDTARVGAVGLSHGGMVTFYLGAVEPRVRAGVAGLTPLKFIADVLSPQMYASHVRMPLLLLMGRTDSWYTQQQVDEVFGVLGSSAKELVWYETGHRVPEAYAGAAVAWFRKYLR